MFVIRRLSEFSCLSKDICLNCHVCHKTFVWIFMFVIRRLSEFSCAYHKMFVWNFMYSIGHVIFVYTVMCSAWTACQEYCVMWLRWLCGRALFAWIAFIPYTVYAFGRGVVKCSTLLNAWCCNHWYIHLLKGQYNEIFDLQFFSSFVPAWATDQWVKIFSILFKFSPSYSHF